jgi:hypothetical protein
MKKIKVGKNDFALVDDEDFEYLNQFIWYLSKQGNNKKRSYCRKLKIICIA